MVIYLTHGQRTLTIEEKCRYTINALMRMRFCKENGELEFEHKLNVDKNPTGYKAWFLHKNRLMKEQKIFFGHWSSLKNVNTNNIYPLDHGCIWGGQLAALLFNKQYLYFARFSRNLRRSTSKVNRAFVNKLARSS